MSTTLVKPKFYWIPEIDGLRGLAILLVICTHYSVNCVPPDFLYWLHPNKNGFALANMAVISFFVISSFLLTFLLSKEIVNNQKINIKNFLLRRIARIWPLYFFILILSYLFVTPGGVLNVTWYEDPDKWQYINDRLWMFFSFVSNWYLTFRNKQNIFPAEMSVLWSVAVEEQIYLILPFLIALFLKISVRKTFFILFILIVMAFASRYLFYIKCNISSDTNRGMYYCTSTYLDVFVIGGIAGYIHAKKYTYAIKFITRVPFFLLVLALAYFSKKLGACLWPPYCTTAIYIYGAIALTFSIFTLKVINDLDSVISKILRNGILRKIGHISYGMYLWHFLVMDITAHYLIKKIDLSHLGSMYVICHFVFYLGITFILSIFTYVIIEKPIIKYMRSFTQKNMNTIIGQHVSRPNLI